MTKTPPKPLKDHNRIPDGGWGWIVVISSCMISIIADGFSYTSGIFYEHFLKVYGQSEAITSMFSSIMTGMIYCIGPFASGLVTAYGCRKIAIFGTILSVIGMISSIIFDSIYFHCITLGLITGTGLGMLYLAQIIIIAFWFDKHISFATGIAVCGSGIGIAIFAFLSEWLITTFSWKGAMLLLSGIMFTSIVFSSTFRNVDYIEEKGDLKTALKETFNFAILKDMVFVYFTFANFLNSFVYYVPILFMKDRIIKLGLGDSNDAIRMMAFFGISNAFGRALFGYIADNKSLNRLLLYGISVVLYGLAIGLTTFAIHSYRLMVICYVIYGFAEGAYVCLSPVVLVDLFGVDKVSNTFGILSFCEGIASAIGPPLIALTVVESYEIGIWISSLITIFTGILLLFLPIIHKKSKPVDYIHLS